MRPLLLKYGGHVNFAAYENHFAQEYLQSPILDQCGYTIIFGDPIYNLGKDCSHICYGGTAGHWGKVEHWNQERAERILWIKAALTSVENVHIHQDSTHPDRRRYLLRIPATQIEDEEFFCVIVHIEKKRKIGYFITAYPITQNRWKEYRNVSPRYYPLATQAEIDRKGKKRREKKKPEAT